MGTRHRPISRSAWIHLNAILTVLRRQMPIWTGMPRSATWRCSMRLPSTPTMAEQTDPVRHALLTTPTQTIEAADTVSSLTTGWFSPVPHRPTQPVIAMLWIVSIQAISAVQAATIPSILVFRRRAKHCVNVSIRAMQATDVTLVFDRMDHKYLSRAGCAVVPKPAVLSAATMDDSATHGLDFAVLGEREFSLLGIVGPRNGVGRPTTGLRSISMNISPCAGSCSGGRAVRPVSRSATSCGPIFFATAAGACTRR